MSVPRWLLQLFMHTAWGLAGTPLAGDRTAGTRVHPHSLIETEHDSSCVFLEKDLCLLSAEMFDFLEDRRPPLGRILE